MTRKRKALAKRKAKRKPRQKRSEHSLGANIRKARQKAGITQLALAHAIGYTGDDAGAYICRVEADSQEPRLETLQRIAEALGINACALLARG